MITLDEETIQNVLNNKLCRLCMAKNENFSSLFECSLLNMIKSCIIIDVQKNDGLPNNICRQCIHSLSRFYTFQQKSQEIDRTLRYNIKNWVVYAEPPILPQAVEVTQTPASTLEYVSQECISLDAIVDDLNLQDGTETFVDELAEIELQEPFVGVIEPSELVEENYDPELPAISNETACAEILVKEAEVFSCPICCKSFSNAMKLKRHVREHTKAKSFICNYCDMGFTEKRFLLKHLIIHDKTREKTHICRICEKSFYDERALSLHSFRHFVSKSIKCTDCDLKFSDKASMKKHIANIHFGEKNFKCEICLKRFQFPSRLKQHLRNHQNEKQFTCSICHASFNQNVLAIHMKTHNSKLLECNFCGKKFTFLQNLKVHEKLHTGEKSFMCDQCGKSFVTSVKLEVHKKTHLENRVKTIACDTCNNMFFTKSALRQHQKLHFENSQQFTCDICLKMFTSLSSMNGHRKRHDPTKEFKCSLCDKTFKALGTLKSHERTHNGNKPYSCPHCPKSFSQSSSRNVHVKSIHCSK